MEATLVLAVSVLLQFVAAMLALRLTWVARAGRAWMLIAAAVFLMAVRRSVTLLRLTSGDLAHPPDLAAELVALGISILMVAGIAWMAPLFLSIRRSGEAIEHLNSVLRAVRNVNQLMVREQDRDRLLKGICDTLIETRGYCSAWVALFDESKEFVTAAEAGLGESFLPVVERLRQGQLSDCRRTVLRQPDILVIEDPPATCPDCPVAEQCADRKVFAIRLEHEQKIYGLLMASVPKGSPTDEEEQSLFQEVASDIAFALHDMDLTEGRKQAEEALRRERDFAEGLIETARVIVLVLDNDGRIVRFNPYMEEVSGYRLEEVRGKDWFTTFLPERDQSRISALFREAAGGVQTQGNVNPIVTKDGREREIEWCDTTLKDASGDIIGVLAIGQDITDRKRAEEALRESYNELQAIYDGMFDGLLVTDAETKEFLRANSAVCQMSGYSENELLTMSVMAFHPPDALPHVLEHFEAHVDGRELVAEGLPFRRKDGTVFYADVATPGVLIEYHERPCLITFIRDITERKSAQAALRESEEFSSSLMNHSPYSIIVVNPDTSVRYVNPALVKLTGFSSAELIGKQPPYPWWTEETLEKTSEDLRTAMSSGANKLDEVFQRKDGERFWVEITPTPVRRNGELKYYLANWVDITERRRAEEQLQASLKEKEILLREIHHRVKNNMQVMISLLRLQARTIKSEAALEAFEEAQNRIKAMALVHETLYQSEGLATFDLQRYIERVGKGLLLAYGRSKKSVDLIIDVRGVAIGIDDVIPLALIINELVSNSFKYGFPEKRAGRITIAAHPVDKADVELVVSDDGVGLPPEIDPHNTQTVGLGLVIGLAENQLGGSVEVARAGGTQFTIRFKQKSNQKET